MKLEVIRNRLVGIEIGGEGKGVNKYVYFTIGVATQTKGELRVSWLVGLDCGWYVKKILQLVESFFEEVIIWMVR